MRTVALASGHDAAEAPAVLAATALATVRGARLVVAHIHGGGAGSAAPRPDAVASRWGRVLDVEAAEDTSFDDVTEALLALLSRVRPDLVVMGSHLRSGVLQLWRSSVAESVARNLAVPTLIVPIDRPGLADPHNGSLRLRNVVVPAGDATMAAEGLRAVRWLLEEVSGVPIRSSGMAVDEPGAEVHVVRVADGGESLPVEDPGFPVTRHHVRGHLETELARRVDELDADLVVMATRGHDGAVDVLVGSHTERLLRRLGRPVLVVPLGARLS